jgi:hypothetical protein
MLIAAAILISSVAASHGTHLNLHLLPFILLPLFLFSLLVWPDHSILLVASDGSGFEPCPVRPSLFQRPPPTRIA